MDDDDDDDDHEYNDVQTNLSGKCRLEVEQVEVWFSDSAARSTDDRVDSAARLLEQIGQPVLHVALQANVIPYTRQLSDDYFSKFTSVTIPKFSFKTYKTTTSQHESLVVLLVYKYVIFISQNN